MLIRFKRANANSDDRTSYINTDNIVQVSPDLGKDKNGYPMLIVTNMAEMECSESMYYFNSASDREFSFNNLCDVMGIKEL